MRFSKLSQIIFHIFIIILCVAPLPLRAADDSGDFLLEQPAAPLTVDQPGVSGHLFGTRASSRKDPVKKPRPVVRKRALALEAMEQEKPLIYLIHGAKALRESWYKPGGDFFEPYSKQAQLAGLGEVIPVSWSGKSGPPEGRLASVRAHIKAARDSVESIRQRMRSRPRNDGRPRQFVLTGHSNGGIIAMLVSHMLFNPLRQKRTQELFENLPASDSSYRLLIECREEIREAVKEEQARWTAQDELVEIVQLFTIATPVDTVLYTAHMGVVKRMYVLFSAGDGIQRFFGKRHYPRGKGALNIRISMESINGGVFYPRHTRMRDPVMAKNLLSLPVLIEKQFGTNLTQLKGIDALLSQRPNVPPRFEKIESFATRSFKAPGF